MNSQIVFVAKTGTATHYFSTVPHSGPDFGERLKAFILNCRINNITNEEEFAMDSLYSFLKKGTPPAAHLRESLDIFRLGAWKLSTKEPVGNYEVMNVCLIEGE